MNQDLEVNFDEFAEVMKYKVTHTAVEKGLIR
jgi:hypothetical protein